MRVKSSDLKSHMGSVNAVLGEVCHLPTSAHLLQLDELSVSAASSAVSLEVTNDLGSIQLAIPLPIPDAAQPEYWIGLHENWRYVNRRLVEFVDCGLRLFIGTRAESPVQVMRLEWVAPSLGAGGQSIYTGGHAGHPHWHIDQAALAGPNDYWRTLDALTQPDTIEGEVEDFDEVSVQASSKRLGGDYSWMKKLHLPARARWMDQNWDGRTIPGPHQCEPQSLDELGSWWAGALRYLATELS